MKKTTSVILISAIFCTLLLAVEFTADTIIIDDDNPDSYENLMPDAGADFFQIHVDGGLNIENAGMIIWVNGRPIYRGRITTNPILGDGGVLNYYTDDGSILIRVRIVSNDYPSIETLEYKFDKEKGKYIQFVYNPNDGSSIKIKQTLEEPVYM